MMLVTNVIALILDSWPRWTTSAFHIDPFWPSRCRTTGSSARSPASRPTNTIASGVQRPSLRRASVPPSRTRRSEMLRAAPPVLLFEAPATCFVMGRPGQGYQWPRTSTAFSSTTMTSSGSPATARRTASCSSSRWTASSFCRSATGRRQRQQRHRPAQLAGRRGGRCRREGSVRRRRLRQRRVVVFDSETGAYKRHWGAYGSGRATRSAELRPGQAAVAAVRQPGALHPPRQGRRSSTSATAPTIGCKCSARTAPSCPSTSTRRRRSATAPFTTWCSRPTPRRSTST